MRRREKADSRQGRGGETQPRDEATPDKDQLRNQPKNHPDLEWTWHWGGGEDFIASRGHE